MKYTKYLFLSLIAVLMLAAFAPVAVPTKPGLVSPINKAVNMYPDGVLLKWSKSAVALPQTISDYDVEVSSSSDFLNIVDTANVVAPTVQYTISAGSLGYGATYYWRVRANDSLGSLSLWSITGVFRVAVEPPTIIALLPADLLTLRPTFHWTPGAQNADSYTIVLSVDSGFSTLYRTATVLYSAIPANQYISTADLPANVTFYWRVRANSTSLGTSAWSTSGSFTTANPPSIPVLVSPKSAKVSPTPTLTWKAVSVQALETFGKYEIQIYNKNLDVLVFSADDGDEPSLATQTTTSYVVPLTANLLPATTYYWRISAYNGNGEYSTSAFYAFYTTIAGRVDAASMNPGEVLGNVPGFENPADPTSKTIDGFVGGVHENANLLGLNPTFKWNPGTLNVQTFTLQIASRDSGSCDVASPQSSTFAKPIINVSLSSAQSGYLAKLDSYPNNILCWRIRGNNTLYGSSEWSNVQIFKTANPPAVPVLSAPKDGILTNDNSPRLEWKQVSLPSGTYFGKYEVEVSYSKTFTGYTYPTDVLPPFTNGASTSYPLPTLILEDQAVIDPVYSVTPPQPSFPLFPMVDQAHDPSTELSNTISEPWYHFQSEHVASPAGDPLYGAHHYYWRVRSYNSDGEYSAWSTPRFLRITVDRPTNLTITDCAGTVVVDPTSPRPCFDWSDVYWASRGYVLKIAKLPTFGPSTILTANIRNSQYQPVKDLPKGVTLYWSVSANNGVSYGVSLPALASSFVSASPPSTPKLVKPISNQLMLTTEPTLTWSRPVDSYAVSFGYYEIQIAWDPKFGSLVEPTYQTTMGDDYELSYTLGSGVLDSARRYYWHVRACNATDQCSTWSPVLYFRTSVATPTLTALPDDTNPLRPIFSWTGVHDAASYAILISKSAACKVPVAGTGASTLTTLYYQPRINLAAATPYYWCVRANSSAYGPGAWSAAEIYTTP